MEPKIWRSHVDGDRDLRKKTIGCKTERKTARARESNPD